jgi:low molecular weight protein-tyrosine phosphatase
MSKIKILFVCLGNICRSPSAEAVLKKMINEENLPGRILVDSAGTIDYHAGELPDPRMIKHAKKRNYRMNHIARVFDPDSDFNNFNYIITMDNENYLDIKSLDPDSKFSDKIYKMSDFLPEEYSDGIPDPFMGGEAEFENVLDLLEIACKEILEKIKSAAKQQERK